MGKNRLTMGLAARLSGYLAILTQSEKSGRTHISSKSLSEYSGVNPTQIRRDLSAFGRFGKRGVGYDIQFLIERIREILMVTGEHNIALMGAGNLGMAISSSSIFKDHGFRIAAVFDIDPAKVGRQVGDIIVQHVAELAASVPEREIMLAVLALPATAAHEVTESLIEAGVRIIFNYSEALIEAPAEVVVHSMNTAGELLHALYLGRR
ncbi:MAG: redox-sensing transcriptional repressor Rex [Thermoleophilia bacterium]